MRDVLQLVRETLPPWPSFWRCALTGAFGIASGFAVFLLWLDHISHEPGRFVVALGVAVLVAFTFDSLKDELDGRQHHRDPPRLLVLVVLLTMAELFIMGFHSTVELKADQLTETLHTLLGKDMARQHALGVVGIWLVLGAAIAVGLGATIFKAGCEIPESEPLSWRRPAVWGMPMLRSAIRGGLTGAVAGPLCMLLYIFVARFIGEYFWILGKPGEWRQHLKGAVQMVGGPGGAAWLVWLPIQAIEMLDGVFGSVVGRHGPFLTLATLLALLVLCAWLRAVRTFLVVLAAMAIVYVYPVLAESGRALRLAGLMAYVWAVPGVLLGALTPWLKFPAGYPKLWGVVAFGAAVVLVIGSVAIPWFIAPAVAFGAVGFWFLRSVEVKQYWAVLALSVGTNIFGATHLVTRADFFNIQKDSFQLTKVPVQAFTYKDPALARIAEILRKLRESDPLRGQSPFLPPGTQLPTSPFRDRSPWATVKVPPDPEAQLAANLDALKAERDRIATLAATFVAGLAELDAMKHEHDEKTQSIATLEKRKYHEQHETLEKASAFTGKAIVQRAGLVAKAAATLDQEGKGGSPGLVPYTGEPTPTALARLTAIRNEQALLRTEWDTVLVLARQVRDRGEGLCAPLLKMSHTVEGLTIDLHDMALRAFEVALTASSGFWITLGLLASWSIRREKG